MKWQLILIMVLMLIPLVIAIEECKGVMNPGDVPCSIISTWQFPNSCNTYNIKVYNQTPINIQNLTLGDYGISGRCNATWNQSRTGSYLLNWSSGDSSKIIVEVEEMSYITIGIMLGIVTFIFAYLTTKVKNVFAQVALSLFTLVMIFFDFFISARIMEIVDSAQTGIIYYLDTFFFIGVTLFRVALAFTIVYLFYYMWKYVITFPMRKRMKRDEEEFYG